MPRHFPNWLIAYMNYTKASESPDQFHFWTGVSTIAAALRRRVWIQQNEFEWTPNMYILLVGPPGVVAKSTSMGLGKRLLAKIPGVTFGPPSSTWQKLTEKFGKAIEQMKLYEDNSPEPVEHKMSCLTFHVSELGTFFRMEDDSFISVLIDWFDAQRSDVPWEHSTISSGDMQIFNPWINLLACTTPAWMQKNFPVSMIGGGLTSRIIFVYGEEKRQLVAYPASVQTDREYQEMKQKMIEDLQEISTLGGEMHLTPDAIRWGTDWYEQHWNHPPPHLQNERFAGYRARKQTHLHKLAMVIAAAQRSKLWVEKEDLQLAEKLLSGVEMDMIKVFNSIGMVDEARQAQEVLSHINGHQMITFEDLARLCRPIMRAVDFDRIIQLLIGDKRIQVVNSSGKIYLTVPTHRRAD